MKSYDSRRSKKGQYLLGFDRPRNRRKVAETIVPLLGVQEAVSSNLAVPTFQINYLRELQGSRFCFADTLASKIRCLAD